MKYWFVNFRFTVKGKNERFEAFTVVPNKRNHFSIQESVKHIQKQLQEELEERGQSYVDVEKDVMVIICFFQEVQEMTYIDFKEYRRSSWLVLF